MGTAFLVLLLAFQTRSRPATPESDAPRSVCEVIMNDPTRLNGRIIKVRGIIGGTDEGIWLVGECKTRLVTKGVTWSNDLSVYVNASDQSIVRSWQKLGAKLDQLHANLRQDKVWVTIIGRLETRASMDEEVQETSHGWVPLGFGHMNGSPAEINVISVEDVTVERRRDGTQKEQ